MNKSKTISSFIGATILNSQIFNNITPIVYINVIFVIILSSICVYLISDCQENNLILKNNNS